MFPCIRKPTAKPRLTDDVSMEDGRVICKRPGERLTVEAVYPSSTRMFLAQLLMCLKRSGPSKIPPYHRDTTTMTLRTSRICGERQTRVSREMSVNVRGYTTGKPFLSSEIFHTRCDVVDESSWFWPSCQSTSNGPTLQNPNAIYPLIDITGGTYHIICSFLWSLQKPL